ncbi:hypothetical protein [Kitasatospora sp. DSM 101779]|uniref:hypothetical protein n=1 Tax=Kitasatospora sp. DSM 101779 TaxID=2853165 RepID=UPI0021D83EBD|nr:hypothetical protein [Kitasatospora sp. DSM 101779]MCU7820434.1 hypothetical protein [Kitasatospora sp. DSM 101779]
MKFHALQPWALVPERRTVDIEAAKERERLYSDNFRFLRAARQPEFCAPWVLGQRIGWRIPSPVDVTLSPLPQVEISAQEAEAAAAAVGKQEVWLRSGTALAMDKPPWLHLFQFREGDGWGSMFVPNGRGTVEWRLGWMPEDVAPLSVLTFPSEELPDLGVQVGVLTAASLGRMESSGFSIAVSPRTTVHVRRGQEIARIVLVGPESLRDS